MDEYWAYCPSCGHEFEVPAQTGWETANQGECPKCREGWKFISTLCADTGDTYVRIAWPSWEDRMTEYLGGLDEE